MDPRLLLTCTLLSSYSFPGKVVDAQQSFVLKNAVLSIEPSTDVARGTNVTVRCRAVISSSASEDKALSREYTIYKDNQKVYTKNSSEDLLYLLPDVRVSETGNFKCSVNVEGRQRESEAKKLTVTGMSKPVLVLNKDEVVEGEEVTAKCEAPGEKSPMFFYFYEDSKEIFRVTSNTPYCTTKISLNNFGTHRIHCTYTVVVMPESFRSNKSNEVSVLVRELAVSPAMVIFPESNIYEGDRVHISCSVTNSLHVSKNITLFLTQGHRLLASGHNKVNHSIVALARDSGNLECGLDLGKVSKVTTETLLVTELFSVPTLTMFPAEVFQKDNITLICKSQHFASERLNIRDLVYSLDPPGSSLTQSGDGVFSGKALQHDFNYTCIAQARGIKKQSPTLTVRPKVSVSTPRISVVGMAVLGDRFRILCHSDAGSLPINYTLLKDGDPVSTVSVWQPSKRASFTATVDKPDDITKYRCEARNSHRASPRSAPLNTTVIEPLSLPSLTVRPQLSDMSEGNPLLLICSVEGTPPVTITLYREGQEQPLVTRTTERLSLDYQVEKMTKEHSGRYYCEAINNASHMVRSEVVDIQVNLAFWKKALIGGFCLLVLLVLVLGCVLYFKSKRGRREAAAELSVKPSSPKSDDSLTVNLTHNSEVYNAATATVDTAVVSVWSERPPQAATDEASSVLSSEPDVEYTEVVHPQPMDPARVPLRKGTDTVYSELKNSPHGAADPQDYGSVEYAELGGEQPEMSQSSPEVSYQDLPVPVD